MPPPSSGGIAVAQILGLLERSALFQTLPSSALLSEMPSVLWAHLFTEASRLAFADRATYVGDPAFVPAPGGDWLQLLAPAYLRQRAQMAFYTAYNILAGLETINNRRKAVMYTHPNTQQCCSNIQPYLRDAIIEYGTDTTRAIAKLLFTGAAAKYRWEQHSERHGQSC